MPSSTGLGGGYRNTWGSALDRAPFNGSTALVYANSFILFGASSTWNLYGLEMHNSGLVSHGPASGFGSSSSAIERADAILAGYSTSFNGRDIWCRGTSNAKGLPSPPVFFGKRQGFYAAVGFHATFPSEAAAVAWATT